MDILILALAAFFTSCIIFFSGFGLGTVLLPVFALFFPLEAAVGLTDAVHFLNNTFNFFIIKKEYDIEILQKFGIPSVLGAVIGLSRSTSNCLSFQIRSVQRSFDISGIIISCAVDFTRISVYMQNFLQLNLQNVLPGLTAAVLSAFGGAYIGNRRLEKVSLKSIQNTVTVLLFLFSLLPGSGII